MPTPAKPGFCELCNSDRPRVRLNEELEVPVCDACYRRELQPRYECGKCGETRVRATVHRGVDYCFVCYGRYLHKRECSMCGKVAQAIVTDEDGNAICRTCYPEVAPKERCCGCGEERTVARREEDRAYCYTCWKKHFYTAECVACGEERTIAARPNGKPHCYTCYDKLLREKEPCCHCGKETTPKLRLNTGEGVCETCYDQLYRERPPCSMCGKTAKTYAIVEGKGICSACHYKHVAKRETCPQCGKRKVLETSKKDGARRCEDCRRRSKTELCRYCEAVKPVKFRLDNSEAVCSACYRKHHRPREKCSECKKVGLVVRRGPDGPTCENCVARERRQRKRLAAEQAKNGAPTT